MQSFFFYLYCVFPLTILSPFYAELYACDSTETHLPNRLLYSFCSFRDSVRVWLWSGEELKTSFGLSPGQVAQ